MHPFANLENITRVDNNIFSLGENGSSRSISKSIDIHPFIERIYLYVRARVDPPPPSIVPKCRKISSEKRCLTNVHSWPMLTHDCGSCVKERACPCRCTRVNSKLEAKGEEGGVGAAWKGGWNRWFIAKVCGIDGTNSLHTDTRAPRLPPTSFPSVNHRFEAVRLAKRLMCVAETRESPFPPPPAPHPVKRRFRIFRTATRSGGMLILSVDRRTNIFQPRTLFVERVSNALDFFFFSIH